MNNKWLWLTIVAAAVLAMAFGGLVVLSGCGGGGGVGGSVSNPESPTLVITMPTAITQGRTVEIVASVSAPAGVDRVVFLIDGINRGTDNAAPFSYEWNTTGEAIGDHVIMVTVFDQSLPARFATATRTVSVVQVPEYRVVGDWSATCFTNNLGHTYEGPIPTGWKYRIVFHEDDTFTRTRVSPEWADGEYGDLAETIDTGTWWRSGNDRVYVDPPFPAVQPIQWFPNIFYFTSSVDMYVPWLREGWAGPGTWVRHVRLHRWH